MALSNRPGVTGRQRCGHESGYERSVRGFKPKTKQADNPTVLVQGRSRHFAPEAPHVVDEAIETQFRSDARGGADDRIIPKHGGAAQQKARSS